MERRGRKETMLEEKSAKKNSPLHFPWVFFRNSFPAGFSTLQSGEKNTTAACYCRKKGQNEVKNSSLALLDGFNAVPVSFNLLMPVKMEMVLGRPLEWG